MQKAKSRQIPGRSALEVETESKQDFAKSRVASRADRAIVRGVVIAVLVRASQEIYRQKAP
jgi:hypothetical protein